MIFHNVLSVMLNPVFLFVPLRWNLSFSLLFSCKIFLSMRASSERDLGSFTELDVVTSIRRRCSGVHHICLSREWSVRKEMSAGQNCVFLSFQKMPFCSSQTVVVVKAIKSGKKRVKFWRSHSNFTLYCNRIVAVKLEGYHLKALVLGFHASHHLPFVVC